MADSAGTNPGSTPDGVGVGEGDSLAEGVGDRDVAGDGEAVGVSDAAGLTAAVGVHPPTRMATATTGKPRLRRRSGVPTVCLYDEARASGHAPSPATQKSATIRSRHMAYAHSEDASSIRVALGNLLRRRREEAERSLSELAEAAELSPAYLSELERGLKDVSSERLVAIARALEVPVAELYLDLARSLGSHAAREQRRSWPEDPRAQLQIATQNLRPQALRSVAHFSLYLAATQATPARRRIGFTVDP